MITAIRTINGGALCTNSSASPKTSSNLETWFNRTNSWDEQIGWLYDTLAAWAIERPAPSKIIVPQGKFFERSVQSTIGL